MVFDANSLHKDNNIVCDWEIKCMHVTMSGISANTVKPVQREAPMKGHPLTGGHFHRTVSYNSHAIDEPAM